MKNPAVLFKPETAVSKDGTTIGYQSLGEGPGVLVIHGALSTSEHFSRFGAELAGAYRVHLIDRRGRGRSGPQGEAYGMAKEIEDTAAVQQATGAEYVFGHSYGGLVALETARTLGLFRKIAVYEPGVSLTSEPGAWDWLASYEKALRNQDDRGAFASFVQGTGHSPLSRLPLWYANLMLRLFVRGARWDEMKKLLPQNLREHREVQRLEGAYAGYQTVDAHTLLAYGGKSPSFVADTIRTLHTTLPHAEMLELPDLEHLSPENQQEPVAVARQVQRFLLN
ncbi:alpha/beta hydrolase [Paenibacillus aurantius]|uniref:Alpha/beta hydrolase n=1 Tax=Paenibacillus aurantius TaxID=2918900 RepID=A0AA96LI43_9BACL|nr:alpha/beta hydrolase [Paenibacillus aurantius]WNQ11927.1 alpha/beta hydrolase [Paenibacillus aurantius]